jgi:prepilin peptidase CpaA
MASTISPHSFVQFLVLLGLLSLAVASDLRSRRIPNSITIPGLLAGLAFGALAQAGVPVTALLGAGLALLVGFPLFALGGLGAGDVKLFMAVGAFVGPGGLLSVLVYGGLAGGVLAIASAVRRGALLTLLRNTLNLLFHWFTGGRAGERLDLHQDGVHTIPYGLAIAAGGLLTWFLPLSLGGLL